MVTTGFFSVCGIAIASASSLSSLRFLFSSSILCVRFHSSRYATVSLPRDIQRLFFLLFGFHGGFVAGVLLGDACQR